ncbi:phospholipase-like protein [Tanacetum coccineum]
MDNVIEVFDAKVKQDQNNNDCPLITYKIGDNSFDFGRQEFCLIIGFLFRKLPKKDSFKGLKISPFCDQVFLEKIGLPLKKVRVIKLLVVTRSPDLWSALSDEDDVKVCLLLVASIVFMGQEHKNYIADNLLELVDDFPAWDAYPWGEYLWRALYRMIVNVISNFKKGDNGNLFAEWSNPILYMAPTSNELLQPWFIISVDYSRTSLVDGEHNVSITTTPQIVLQEHVVEHHAIVTSVQMIENVGDGDSSIVLQELAAVKERIIAIERFIKSKNDSLLEDLVAKHKEFVHKENESGDGKCLVKSGLDGMEGFDVVFGKGLECVCSMFFFPYRGGVLFGSSQGLTKLITLGDSLGASGRDYCGSDRRERIKQQICETLLNVYWPKCFHIRSKCGNHLVMVQDLVGSGGGFLLGIGWEELCGIVVRVWRVLALLTSSTNTLEKEALTGFADEVIYSLFVKQSEDRDLLHEDLEQIDDLDIEEMDIN